MRTSKYYEPYVSHAEQLISYFEGGLQESRSVKTTLANCVSLEKKKSRILFNNVDPTWFGPLFAVVALLVMVISWVCFKKVSDTYAPIYGSLTAMLLVVLPVSFWARKIGKYNAELGPNYTFLEEFREWVTKLSPYVDANGDRSPETVYVTSVNLACEVIYWEDFVSNEKKGASCNKVLLGYLTNEQSAITAFESHWKCIMKFSPTLNFGHQIGKISKKQVFDEAKKNQTVKDRRFCLEICKYYDPDVDCS